MARKNKKQKVIVAMSGGVDSSAAAALLKRAGFNVVGVFMKFWHEGRGAENRCCSLESQVRARQVAAKIGIPFYVFNFEKEFKKRIVDCFLKEYRAGKTPNPCVICNKEIKFGLLLEKALALGVDYIATGHYCRKIQNPKSKIQKLLKAKDKNKDQSYFLWQLNQKQLSHVLFPVGDLTKKEVRKLAEKFGLPTAATPDSQEICFVPNTINDFLAKHIKSKPGQIKFGRCLTLNVAQACATFNVKHRGLPFYTIGQRKGIGLSGGPYWVLDKDLKNNRLIVTKNEKDLLRKELVFKNANWISPKQSLRDATGQAGKEPKLPMKVSAKIRYRSKFASAVITKTLNPKRYTLKFTRPQRAITPGQSVVFYSPAEARRAKEGKRAELLGGGIIC